MPATLSAFVYEAQQQMAVPRGRYGYHYAMWCEGA